MAAAKPRRLRIGVIGLGRLWEARHKPALARMTDRFRISAVYDQVIRQAELAANVHGCVAAGGIAALVDRADVEAIYVLSPQWFGLHALGLAVATGKPVYCALPMGGEPEALDRLDAMIRSSGTTFMPEFARRFYPATTRLRELLATRLGLPRRVTGLVRLTGFDRYVQPGPTTQIAPAPILIDPGGYLIDWCRTIFQAEPTSIRRLDEPETPDVATLAIDFPEGATAELTIIRDKRGAATESLPTPGLQVDAERGTAWLDPPDRIVWTVGGETFDERHPLQPTVGEWLNAQFHRAVCSGVPCSPNWSDALAVARLVASLGPTRTP